jgi:hypothetical protein
VATRWRRLFVAAAVADGEPPESKRDSGRSERRENRLSIPTLHDGRTEVRRRLYLIKSSFFFFYSIVFLWSIDINT